MKKKAASLILVLFLALAVLPCFAGSPPPDPPADPPKTMLPKMVGTWTGKAYVAKEKGYSSFDMTLKITDQSGDMFRGYVSDANGKWQFVAGYRGSGNTLTLATQSQTWTARMWWEGPVACMGFVVVNDDIPFIMSGQLSKTTQ